MERVLLTDVCNFQYGYAFDSRKFSNEGKVPLVRIRDVVRGYSETYTDEDFDDNYLVHDGDMLIGMDGEFNIAYWHGGDAALNQRVCKLVPSDKIDSAYIFYRMMSVLKQIESKTPFVTVKHLSAKELNAVYIDLPNISEQEMQGKKLRYIDGLIAKNDSKLKIMDILVKSRFIELFGDIKLNSKKWSIVKLEDIADVGSSKRVFVEELLPTGIPFYRGTEIGALAEGKNVIPDLHITKVHYKELCDASGTPQYGDLLMPSICPDGRIWLVDTDEPFYFKDGRVLWVHLTSNEFNNVFVQYVMKFRMATEYEQIASGTTFKELKIFTLKLLDVVKPPIDIQKQFADFVAITDKSKLSIQQSIETLQTLKARLMQDYFG